MQCTKCACMHSYIVCLTGCLCQGGTKSPLSPLCAIMLIVESNSIIISNECESIVLLSGRWWIEGGNMVFFLLVIQEIHSHICRWLTNEMLVCEMVLDMIITELIMWRLFTDLCCEIICIEKLYFGLISPQILLMFWKTNSWSAWTYRAGWFGLLGIRPHSSSPQTPSFIEAPLWGGRKSRLHWRERT